MDFPQTSHMLMNALFVQQIRPLFNDTENAKAEVERHRPPTRDDIETFLAKSDDPYVTDRLRQIGQMEREAGLIREKLVEFAKEQLHSPANEDERKAARQKFNHLKKKLIASLHSLGHVAASENEQSVVEWVEIALGKVPKLSTSTVASHDLKAMRQWLQENHPEANIKSRGTIPLEWKQVYYSRNE